MDLAELFILAVSLAMDAFAVSVCKGMAMRRPSVCAAVIAGVWFGGFQALMPVLGYLAGSRFSRYVVTVSHWIAFILLALIGINMIREALSGEEESVDDSLAMKTMFLLAVATSIDALAVGVTFAFLNVRLLPAAGLIGVVTFFISAIGISAGNLIGMKWKNRAAIAGGAVLILIGIRILI